MTEGFPPQSCALIGGTVEERMALAAKLRRLGIGCFTEFKNRKRDKMFNRACEENFWGEGGVYDIDNAEDRAWLERDDLKEVGV